MHAKEVVRTVFPLGAQYGRRGKYREGDAAELTITLPALRDPDTDLSDADLDAVGGGTLFGGWQPSNTYGSGQPGCTG